MEYKSLEIFVTLAEKLNFRQTSEIHNMTPSTLSRVIRRLEEETGCNFFIRDNTAVTITKNGEKFYEFAKEAINRYDDLKNSLSCNDPKLIKGSIIISTGIALTYAFLPPVIKKFSEKYPNISVNFSTGSTYKNIQRMMDGEYDFMLQTGGGIPDSETIKKRISLTLPVVLVSHKDMPKLRSLEDLEGKPFIISQYPDFYKYTESIFRKYNVKPRIAHYIDGHETMCAMVASGMGYSFIPQLILDQSHMKDVVEISDLIEPLPDLEPVIRMKKQKYINHAKAAFWDFIDTL